MIKPKVKIKNGLYIITNYSKCDVVLFMKCLRWCLDRNIKALNEIGL